MSGPRQISEINNVLSSIRSSLDATAYPVWMTEHHHDVIRKAYLDFEDVRFSFHKRTSDFQTRRDHEYVQALSELRSRLMALSGNAMFMEVAEQAKYRVRQPAHFTGDFHYQLSQSGGSVRVAINNLISSCTALLYPYGIIPKDSSTPDSDLRDIVPKNQNTSPLKFDIRDGRLVIAPQSSSILDSDLDNQKSAKSEIIVGGRDLLENLDGSNADRRLIASMQHVQDKVENDDNIVQVGLAAMTFEAMCDSFAEEFSLAISGLTKAQILRLNMYLLQFPAWRRFVEQAASAKLTRDDSVTIAAAIQKVVLRLREVPQISDPEVPRTLEALNSLISDPVTATKRAVFAVWRSLENLVISVFNFGAELLSETARKSVDKVSTAASRAAAIALISAALVGAASLLPLVARVPESAWLIKAVELVEQQLGRLM